MHHRTVENIEHDFTDSPPLSDNWIYSLHAAPTSGTDIKCKLIVNETEAVFQIDTGSSTNMLPRHLTKNVTPTTKTLRMWNGAVLNPIGVCRMPVTNI